MATVNKALIIGGGIAGPVTALALRKAGIEAVVYEAYPAEAGGVGASLMLAPNGLAALQIVGADEAVRAVGQPMPGMVMQDARGHRFGGFPGLPGVEPSLVLRRSDLYRALHDHAEAQGVTVEYGKQLVAVDETPDGITAKFADGSTASGDILVGADGIRSTVRDLIDHQAPGPAYVGLLGFGGRSAATGVRTEPGHMHFAFGRKAFLGYWTEPDGQVMWFSNLPRREAMSAAEARAAAPADWLAEMREVYAGDSPAREIVGHAAADELFVLGPMEILPPVPHWHGGRMVLVGDSAHAPSSSSGQGASLAAESAVQLARALRDLPEVPSAFAAYERLRRTRVEKIAANAAKQNNVKGFGPVARTMMNLLAPLALKTFLTPEKMFGPVQRFRIDWDAAVTENTPPDPIGG